VVTSTAFILRLSVGLAILYGAVIVVWYELLRSVIVRRRTALRGRSDRIPAATSHPAGSEQSELAEGEPESAAQRAAEESELERAHRHYHLAREDARTERDAAIAAANEAAEEAIRRIERRYREIDEAFIDEETERINEMLRRPPGEPAP
jgi:hypothetical protein